MKNIFILVWICVIVTFIASCNEQVKVTIEEKEAPVLHTFSPSKGKIGTEITITGENLSDVNNVTIGGGKADIKYRINNNVIIIKVSSESVSGIINVKNGMGESESTDEFKIVYVVPEITSIPQKFDVGSEILIEGINMEVVRKVTFGTDNIPGKITYQSENEILVTVPNVDEANVKLVYFDGISEQAVIPDNEPEINKPEPQFVLFELTEAKEGTTLDFIGEKLNLIDKIMIGSYEIPKEQFIKHLDNIISVTVPEVENDEAGLEIKAFYYTNKHCIISANFKIKNVVLYFYENITMGAHQAFDGGCIGFNPMTGQTYSICDLLDEDNRNSIYFLTLWTSSELRFVGPHDASSKIKSYLCGNTAIGTQKFQNTVLFRVLDNDNEGHKKYIDAVVNKTLSEIPNDITTDISIPGSSGIKYFNSNEEYTYSANVYTEGSVIFYALVNNKTDKKPIQFGFIHVTSLNAKTYVDDTGKAGEITFNCYCQK